MQRSKETVLAGVNVIKLFFSVIVGMFKQAGPFQNVIFSGQFDIGEYGRSQPEWSTLWIMLLVLLLNIKLVREKYRHYFIVQIPLNSFIA